MILKFVFINFLLLASFIRCNKAEHTEYTDEDKQKGLAIALNALGAFINGDPPGTKTYKDLFIDTSKTVFDQIENAIV